MRVPSGNNKVTDSFGLLRQSLPIFLPNSRRKTCLLLSFSGDPSPRFVLGIQWNKSNFRRLFLSGPLPFHSCLLVLRIFLLFSRGPEFTTVVPYQSRGFFPRGLWPPSIFKASDSQLSLSQIVRPWLCFVITFYCDSDFPASTFTYHPRDYIGAYLNNSG